MALDISTDAGRELTHGEGAVDGPLHRLIERARHTKGPERQSGAFL